MEVSASLLNEDFFIRFHKKKQKKSGKAIATAEIHLTHD
jgi:hypothetical protein